MKKLEKLQRTKEIITKQDICQTPKSNYQLIAIDISKQKVLDADPVADQQIEVNVDLRKKLQICTILEK